MSIIFHNHLAKIADTYQAFIIDLWGVLHDGQAPYPKAVDTLKSLRQRNKKIILLSNAPRRAFKAEKVMSELGFSRDLYDHLLTSGEITYDYLKSGNQDRKYFYIGPVKDEDILNGLAYRRVYAATEADFALATGFDNFGDKFESKLPEIKACLTAELPLICANPDRMVVRQNGEIMLCAGVIADYYQQYGGKVTYFGKPYEATYRKCFELLGAADTSKIAAIGDSLHTDIAGANKLGIFSILIAGGILAKELEITYGQLPQSEILEILCRKEGAFPDAVLPAFVW